MNSLTIKEFEQSIINFTNQVPLPLEVKRLVFADILHQLEIAAVSEAKAQAQERKMAKKTKEKESVENGESIRQD